MYSAASGKSRPTTWKRGFFEEMHTSILKHVRFAVLTAIAELTEIVKARSLSVRHCRWTATMPQPAAVMYLLLPPFVCLAFTRAFHVRRNIAPNELSVNP